MPTMKILPSCVFAALLGLLSGCATIDDLSSETYRRVSFSSNVFDREVVGLLPMSGTPGVQDYVSQADLIFQGHLRRLWEGRPHIEARESLQRIRKAGLERVYQDWAKSLASGRPPEQDPPAQIGKAIGARYLLQPELQRIELAEGATQVRLVGRIWDAEKGDLLWEGLGESRGYVMLIFPWVPSSFEKTMAVASKGLIRRMP